MAFALDTSGTVHGVPGAPAGQGTYHPVDLDWCDLSPFAQGYVEALFADFRQRQERRFHENPAFIGQEMPAQRGFSDLAPETLARIIADCEKWCSAVPSRLAQRQVGGDFWRLQQLGKVGEALPLPLAVQPGDDGKVRFAETQKEA